MAGRATLLIALALVLGCYELGDAQTVASASLRGRVTEVSVGMLPGVRVTVTGPGLQTEAITDEDGQFEIEGLLQTLPVTYTLKAELPGFETATVTGITADPARPAEIDVRMRLGCLADPGLGVTLPLAEVMSASEVVALVRLDSFVHHRRLRLEDGCGPVTEFAATILEPIKGVEADSPREVRFALVGARDVPWETGMEHIAFLQWHPSTSTYRLSHLVPVGNGTVNSDPFHGIVELHDGVPLSDALTELRSLVAQP